MKPFLVIATISIFSFLFAGYTYLILTLPERSLPLISTVSSLNITEDEDHRLVFIGDVHGMYDEFLELVDKLEIENSTTLVLLGDFVSKGPDSVQMVDYILEHKNRTQCVLGNHELSVLFALLNPKGIRKFNHMRKEGKKQLISSRWNPIEFVTEDYIPHYNKINSNHRELAKEIGWDKLSGIAEHCCAVLKVPLHDQTLIGVHAGLIPGDLETPHLKDITTMKFVDSKDHTKTSKTRFKKSIPWYRLWKTQAGSTVLYGHDAKTGLNIRKHTKGLDSACVAGGQLSALEYTYHNGAYNTKLHQVDCRKHI